MIAVVSGRRGFTGTVSFRWLILIGLAMPVMWMLWSAWTSRWLTDDGFINVRVVRQILDGNGPVFNVGERVETTTSVLWLACLVVGKLLFFWVPVEWVAVILGISMTVAAVALATITGRRAYGTPHLLPMGAIAYVALPPAAVFATAGLEMGLTLLWISGWYLLLVRTAGRGGRGQLAAAFVLGLGPLIRPDLIVMSVLGIAALLVLEWRAGLARVAAITAAAAALPLAYELFRMGYYGNLLPNPAYVKEATTPNWLQGWEYLKDFNRPYWVWVPALVGSIAGGVAWRGVRSARLRVAIATPAVAGITYGIFVIRGGADFMHARMLLPVWFALLLPIAAVPLQRGTLCLSILMLLWAAVPIAAGGPPYDLIGPHGITNERNFWVGTLRNPVTVDDFAPTAFVQFGHAAREWFASGHRDVAVFALASWSSQPVGPQAPPFVQRGVFACCTIGMTGVAAGDGVYIADECGLASPIGSRLTINHRGRPGHEKILQPAWIFAMFGDPQTEPKMIGDGKVSVTAADVELARRALRCPTIQRMLARARAPLTVERIKDNVLESVTDFTDRIDRDPAKQLARCSTAE